MQKDKRKIVGSIEDFRKYDTGSLTILAETRSKRDARAWECLCSCGTIIIVETYDIISGHTKSCGCQNSNRIGMLAALTTTHGLTYHPLYGVWTDMKTRCLNSRKEEYKNYGGRGITVCDEWRNSFESFYFWAIENGWSKGLEINRVDNNGNYCPENCDFITRKNNCNNRRNTKKFVLGDIEVTILKALEITGNLVSQNTAYQRIFKYGWNPEKALTTPARTRGRN